MSCCLLIPHYDLTCIPAFYLKQDVFVYRYPVNRFLVVIPDGYQFYIGIVFYFVIFRKVGYEAFQFQGIMVKTDGKTDGRIEHGIDLDPVFMKKAEDLAQVLFNDE